MSELQTIQSWLSSELELYGIDAVIYTRHVINLLINSRYMTDLHLAQKEENIFASLPGSKKRKPKHKYNKRSNSFTFSDDVLLKKEMAANCLRSAVEDKAILEGDIEALIENLYNRLEAVNLFSDGNKSSSSDESQTGGASVSIKQKKRRDNKEDYDDAFPSLVEEMQHKILSAVWGRKSDKSTVEPKSGNKFEIRPKVIQKTRRRKKKHLSAGDNVEKSVVKQRRSNPRCIEQVDGKVHPRSKRSTKRWSSSAPSCLDYDKENKLGGSKTGNTKNQKRKIGINQRNSNQRKIRKHGFYENNENSNMMAQLPKKCFLYPGYLASKQNLLEEDICHLYTNQEILEVSVDRPQSKWFRDPESGFLEFEPAYKSPSQGNSPDPASESWLWCPSPSLWEDEECQLGGASRLETLYKPRLTSNESVGQLWEGYQAIFADVVQKPHDQSSHKAIFAESSRNSADSSSLFEHSDQEVFSIDLNENCDENGNYLSSPPKPAQSSVPECCGTKCNICSIFDKSALSLTGNGTFGSNDHGNKSLQSRKEIWLQNTSRDDRKADVGILTPHNDFYPTFSPKYDWLEGCLHDFTDFGTSFQEFSGFQSSFYDFPGFTGPFESFGRRFYDFPKFESSVQEFGLGRSFQEIFSIIDADWMFRAPEDDDRVSSLVQSVLEVVTIAADDDCHRSQKTLDDCVTENEAWKTSLRIGNIWQSISGIRPVDIVYSEKQTSSEGEALLQPSSLTHFRPIDAWTEPDSDTTTSSSYNDNTSFTPVEHIADEYIEFSSPQKNAQNHSTENIITERSNFRPKFRKLGEDKCLQTSFHEQMRYREGKPPKANSR